VVKNGQRLYLRAAGGDRPSQARRHLQNVLHPSAVRLTKCERETAAFMLKKREEMLLFYRVN
jgi:hypothetical protein